MSTETWTPVSRVVETWTEVGDEPATPDTPGSPPVNTALPVITGSASVGQTLTVSNGSWTNSPVAFTQQWTRGGVAISGATQTTYVLVSDDEGASIACIVTAITATALSATATAAAVSVTSYSPSLDFSEPRNSGFIGAI